MYEVLKRGRIHNLAIECQLELFNKMVKPILLYGSEVWGFCKNIQCIERVQLRFCKLLLKLKSSTPNYMIYGELGIFPIQLDIKLKMIAFWTRLLSGKDSKLSYLSYQLLYKLSVDNHFESPWLKFLRNVFDDTGFSYIWTTQLFPSSDWLIPSIKMRLHDQFRQEWHSLMLNSPKSINYRLFKETFQFECFFKYIGR